MEESRFIKKIGVPFPSSHVCGHMEVDDPMKVLCLTENDAWDLFLKKVGQRTLNSHPDIPEKVRKVAKKSRGLPLALNASGEAMACKSTIEEWSHAIDVLTCI